MWAFACIFPFKSEIICNNYTYHKSVSLVYVCSQIQHRACQHTNRYQFCYGIALADRILECHNRARMHLKIAFTIHNKMFNLITHTHPPFLSLSHTHTTVVGWNFKIPLASRSYLIRLRIAAHGRSVFSKQRHHSRVDKLPSLSTSHVSINGLMHRSFWSCSKSNSSDVDSDPSLLMSKWPNIHFASIW